MRLYRTPAAIVLGYNGGFYLLPNENWDTFVNDDELYDKLATLVASHKPDTGYSIDEAGILPPLQSQEVWACGVTYYRSKVGRQEESKATGGADFYARVYEAERPEIFFKATPHRVVGHRGAVRIRRDSTWDVPEPELTLMITSSGKIVGYTIGNDMSSRSIEGENPLYLPQAKTYDGSAAIGPCLYVPSAPLPSDTEIKLNVTRENQIVFEGRVAISQIKRTLPELVSFAFRECSFPHGCLLMTGTGIVPGSDFTLRPGDEIAITVEPIGTLINVVDKHR